MQLSHSHMPTQLSCHISKHAIKLWFFNHYSDVASPLSIFDMEDKNMASPSSIQYSIGPPSLTWDSLPQSTTYLARDYLFNSFSITRYVLMYIYLWHENENMTSPSSIHYPISLSSLKWDSLPQNTTYLARDYLFSSFSNTWYVLMYLC